MRISFVIPAHNEERELPATLAAIGAVARELGLDHEVIVADDASTDRTAEVGRAAGATVVSHERRQIAATRNLGARASGGDLLIFVDADTRVSTGAVRQAIAAVTNGAVGGGAPMRFDGRIPLYARVLLPAFNALFRFQKRTGGAFLFCTRTALERAGGWDETVFVAEELFLAAKLQEQGRFVIVRTPVVTSGRKLRTYSGLEMFGLVWRAALMRRKMFESRTHLGLWYGERREDPGEQALNDRQARLHDEAVNERIKA